MHVSITEEIIATLLVCFNEFLQNRNHTHTQIHTSKFHCNFKLFGLNYLW